MSDSWLDGVLDTAEKYLDDSEATLFEIDYANEGLKILRENKDVIVKLGQDSFAKTMVLLAAGSPEEARQAVLESGSWEYRNSLRQAARQELRDEDEASAVWSILGDIAVTMVKAALPFILAAVV